MNLHDANKYVTLFGLRFQCDASHWCFMNHHSNFIPEILEMIWKWNFRTFLNKPIYWSLWNINKGTTHWGNYGKKERMDWYHLSPIQKNKTKNLTSHVVGWPVEVGSRSTLKKKTFENILLRDKYSNNFCHAFWENWKYLIVDNMPLKYFLI